MAASGELQEIIEIVRGLTLSIRELRELAAENERQRKIVWAETDRRLDERFAKAEQEIAALRAENDRRAAENEKRVAENDRLIAESAKRMSQSDGQWDETKRQLGRLGNRLGDFVEGLVRPAALPLFQERGYRVGRRYCKAQGNYENRTKETDIVLVDGEVVIAIEVKSQLSVADVNKFLGSLAEFKLFFPDFRDKRIIGAVAAMTVEGDADRCAYKKGLFVIGPRDDGVVIMNDADFRPAEW